MECTHCHFENPKEMQFCGQCGAKLEKRCPQCQFSNPPRFAFCGQCGQHLNLESVQTPEELPFDEKLTKIQKYLPQGLTEKILSQKDRIEGEHKQVTVMFCDLEQYTRLSGKLGPEKTYQLMDEVYELLIHEVHRYQGTVNELTGDGILALFGAPIALEDAPQMAVRSALSIQKEMARISEEKQVSLKMRIGIHSGTVVVGTLGNDLRVDFKAVGDTVNLAARLEQLSAPGSILVSESTLRLTEGLFRFEALGNKIVKGKADPIAVYRILGSGRSRSRFEARAQKGLTRFVGRERELEILGDCFERVRKEKGQAVSIVAEAGMGKSRLLYEFRNSLANEDVTFLEGRCVSYGQNIPYLPVIDVLRDNFRIQADDGPNQIHEKIKRGWEQIQPQADQTVNETLPYLLELFSVENGFDALKHIDPDIKRRKTFEVLKELSLKGSRVRPLVIVFEDLHWIDRTTEDTIKLLIENIPGARILLLLTFRSNYLPAWGGKTYYSQITLNRLANRESLDMIHALLEAQEIAEDLGGLILEKSEGVPFFIEEFTKSLQASGSVRKADGRCHLSADLSSFGIPETLHDLLMSRVDKLPEGAKEILQIGSVIEREFGWNLLTEVTGLEEMELLARLSHLKEAELIFERGIFPQVNYIFQHALTRELVYNSLLTEKRRECHRLIAKAMEKIFADRLEEHSPMLALHFTKGSDAQRGYAYHHRAGNLAARSYANQEALEHFRAAWRLADELTPDSKKNESRLDTAVKLAEVMETLGEFEPTLALLEEVLPLAKSPEHIASAAGIQYWMGHTLGNLGRYDDARGYLNQSLESSQKIKNIEIEGAAHDYLGQLDFFQAYLKKAFEHMTAAIQCQTKAGGSSRLPWTHAFKALIFCNLKGADDWASVVEEAENVIKNSGNDRAGCLLYTVKYQNAIKTGRYEDALNYALAGLRLAEKIGEGIQIPFLLAYAAVGALQSGQGEYAFQLAREGEAASDKVGHPLTKIVARNAKALVLMRLGRVKESMAPARACLELCRQLELGLFLMQTLETNAEILANLTPPDKKQIFELMEQAAILVERSESPWFRIDYLLARIRICMKLKSAEEAGKCLAAIQSVYRAMNLENGTQGLRALANELAEPKTGGKG
jgi:class 3 adenylate cyclase/tetratricopeptide (TPR) repeat protein